MADESKHDVPCGEYTVPVADPEEPPPPAYRTTAAATRHTPTQECWPHDLLGDHGPVDGDKMRHGAREFCESGTPSSHFKGAKPGYVDGIRGHVG
ncbi:hypothetical protein VUR80DRAFT_7246 [Thermomyces stellatus]